MRVAPRDLHSGVYGGTVANALHVLHGMLAAGRAGARRARARGAARGHRAARPAELASWAAPAAGRRRARRGRRPDARTRDAGATTTCERRRRVARRQRDPRRRAAHARARGGARDALAAPRRRGQDPDRMAEVLEGLLRARRRRTPRSTIETVRAAPALFDADARPASRSRRRRSSGRSASRPRPDAQRRLDPGGGGARPPRDPDDRQRVRAVRRPHPLARRVLPAHLAGARGARRAASSTPRSRRYRRSASSGRLATDTSASGSLRAGDPSPCSSGRSTNAVCNPAPRAPARSQGWRRRA